MNKTKLVIDILITWAVVCIISVAQYYFFGGEKLSVNSNKSVLELTFPSNPHSGGTGFVIKAPSGKAYTVTNRHICRGAELGQIMARSPNSDRYLSLRVLEMSQLTDLCLLTPFPNVPALELGENPSWGDIVTLIGHPLLFPVTRTKGEFYEEELINLVIAVDTPDIESMCQKEHGNLSTEISFFGAIKVCTKDYWANRTNVTSFPGNSGSPILNSVGKVVSVLFAGDNRTNWGYGIPYIDLVRFLSIY